MKKIITLFASVILVTSAFAQYRDGDQKDYGRGKGNDVVYNNGNGRYDKDDNRWNGHYGFNKREIDLQVFRINQEYDQKIYSVKNRWFTNRAKKERIICALEDQRNYEIKKVYMKYSRGNDRFDDHDRRRNW